MSDNNNIQKNLDKYKRKRANLFCDLAEQNLLNGHLIQNTRKEYEKAVKEDNEVMKMILKEQFDAYAQSMGKNLMELEYLMTELGYDEINFKLN